MKSIILLLSCVCGNHGSEDRIDIPFNIFIINGDEAYCEQTQEQVVKEDRTVRLFANLPYSDGIYRAHCKYNNGTGFRDLAEKYYKEVKRDVWSLNIKNIKKDKFGDWRCRLGFNKFNRHGLQHADGDYTYVNCTVHVKGTDDNETPTPTKEPLDIQTIAIISSVGILVLVIIIAQTIALCYFKKKAQPRRRMDKLTTRNRFDRGDQARYSAPPCRKGSKGNVRAQADTDSHIYEMVGVNALYKESSELNQEVKNGTNEKNIKDRPPLPLPYETADPWPQHSLPRPKPSPLKSTLSTTSLISNTSTLNSKKKSKDLPAAQGFKKAPARPPKQIDDMPGSLKRPPKVLPSPALVPKTGSMPKMPACDPAMQELRNMFKSRNIGNVSDSPAASPTSTLEIKPPKVQAKPNKTQPKQEEPTATPPRPIGGMNPLVPPGPNQKRLILPKIEACLKSAPKAVPTPQNYVKPIPAPLNKPTLPIPMSQPTKTYMSLPTPNPHHTPTSHPTHMSPPLSRPLPPVSHLTPSSVPVPHMSPIQNRPLPIPHEAPTSRPLPPGPIPIYQMTNEDESPHTNDDDQWTYEELGKYNLYNI